MKARQRTYEQGLKDGIKRSVEALMASYSVAMDDKGLCKATIRAVTTKADFLFAQILEENLRFEDILEESNEILSR